MDKNVLVAIDYSYSSTGLCFLDLETGNPLFAAYLNRWSLTGAKDFDPTTFGEKNEMVGSLQKIDDFILRFGDREPMKLPTKKKKSKKQTVAFNPDLTRYNRELILQTLEWSDSVFMFIWEILKERFPDHKPTFSLETYSMASETSNLIQMVAYTEPLKRRIYGEYGIDSLHFVTGPEIKMLAGSGNYTKHDMYEAFKKDTSLASSVFWSHVNSNPDFIIKETTKTNTKTGAKIPKLEIRKPYEDIFDSFWQVKLLHAIVKSL